MKKPIRILQIVATMGMGGIENFLMNLYRNIDRNKIQFDFLVHYDEKGVFEEEIEKLGGKIYKIPFVTKVGHFNYLKTLRNFYKEHPEYKIVHSHYNAMSGFILREAKKAKIPVRISHSHIAYPKYSLLGGIYKNYSKLFINQSATHRFACSKMAGEWLYSKKIEFKVINNGIVADKYAYSEKEREKIRKALDVRDDEILIGHIGRFDPQKNHEFIIDTFNEVLKLKGNYKLCLVGNGDLKNKIEEKAKQLNIEDKINFLGIRKDVPSLLQAFDLFILPSKYEGLGIVLIEAQASGLPSLITESIPQEAVINKKIVKRLKLEVKEWTKEIINTQLNENRENKIENVKENNYDIISQCKYLEELYKNLI